MAIDTGFTAAAVLARAAAMAGYAPSVHNTQPWRWTIRTDRMELTAVWSRQLPAIDPDGRLLLLSCGAALHHARTTLTATGWDYAVERLPTPGRPDLLAVLTPTAHRQPDPAATRLVQTMEVRHTDRRPVSDTPVSETTLKQVVAAAEAEDVACGLLTGERVFDLAAAASRADAVEKADPEIQEELAYWIGRHDRLGIPSNTLTGSQPATTVPVRDFGQPGVLPSGPGHDRAARYAVLFGANDEPSSWLRAGEALSAAWLTATRLGASVLPLSAVIEVPVTRTALRRAIDELGWPYLVLRIGVADPDHTGAVHPPRLPTAQIVDVEEVRHLLDQE
ncbi:Acg family FMN-binding oxidoreductase [Krasilnikovia sp. MM14-A1259]|uniref:Acg family FMN-binding oxidoreductase n=1 Tax=Krasilnikovia sp. MM14-A1259 TaxID=3373539 RepID=UPI0037F61557